VWSLVKDTVKEWDAHHGSRLAASLACYTLLSIAPLVVLSVALAGWIFGERAARGEIAAAIGSVVGPSAASAIQAIVVNARPAESHRGGTVVGLVILVLGASGVFHELQSALNTIWSVEPAPGRGLLEIIRHRVISFAMVVVVAFLLLVSLLVSAALEAMGKFFAHALPGGAGLWRSSSPSASGCWGSTSDARA
jgi:membrane protein